MIYYVYILYSAIGDIYYVGFTSDLESRLQKHLSQHKGFTGRYKDWEIVYTETFDSKTAAYQRERQIKHWRNRQMIERLILGKD